MGPPNTNPSNDREEDLNPGPPDYESSVLTTRPRYFLMKQSKIALHGIVSCLFVLKSYFSS